MFWKSIKAAGKSFMQQKNNDLALEGYSPDEIKNLLALDGRNFIDQCYAVFLGRHADQDGLVHHTALLASGTDKRDIICAFHESVEAIAFRNAKQAPKSNDARAMVNVRRAASGDGGARPRTAARTLWVDMTTAFEWTGGVVGIVRAELELAVGLKKLDPGVRFSMCVESGFVEIPAEQLSWLLTADSLTDAYLAFFKRQPGADRAQAGSLDLAYPESFGKFAHPYAEGDVVFSAGWIDSRKEVYFSTLKNKIKGVKICYLIYDAILILDETACFYDRIHSDRFKNYIRWVSHNADFLLFGGETARNDVTRIQQMNGWPTPPSQAIKFGGDIRNVEDFDESVLAEMGVRKPFIITVGSIEPRKNHETLYRAYLLALASGGKDVPQLVICGKPSGRTEDLVDTLRRDPRLAGNVLLLQPTDRQLAALYKYCRFTVLPSVYEGWSLTLPESLESGKFCIASDCAPLREIGRDLIAYVAPYDARGWADAILRFSRDTDELQRRESRIAAEWKSIRWQDASQLAYSAILSLEKAVPAQTSMIEVAAGKPTIWMDLTLTYLQWGGGLTGIPRAELTIAQNLKRIAPDTRYFAYDRGVFFEISDEKLQWLFKADDLQRAYNDFHEQWKPLEANGSGSRSPFYQSGPTAFNEASLTSIGKNSIVFFAGIDFGYKDNNGEERLHQAQDIDNIIDSSGTVMKSQLIYDFTPILLPHVHAEATCIGYDPFVNYISRNFDHIVYGGRTAQRDGLAIQSQRGLPQPANDFLEFGSDIIGSKTTLRAADHDKQRLELMGVKGDFIMTVGTIEPRKNHEVLYKALLQILERNELSRPLQIAFVGKQGWKSSNFLQMIWSDKRIAGKLLILTPDDSDLDILYRHAKFTLLPSFYEGWSLTLPESLSYGKFCLVSDSDPLRETGGDLVEYINPYDTRRWAERITYYAKHPAEIAAREAAIRKGWKPTTWRDATENLVDRLHVAHARFVSERKSTKVMP